MTRLRKMMLEELQGRNQRIKEARSGCGRWHWLCERATRADGL
jgi:hypothetical protein